MSFLNHHSRFSSTGTAAVKRAFATLTALTGLVLFFGLMVSPVRADAAAAITYPYMVNGFQSFQIDFGATTEIVCYVTPDQTAANGGAHQVFNLQKFGGLTYLVGNGSINADSDIPVGNYEFKVWYSGFSSCTDGTQAEDDVYYYDGSSVSPVYTDTSTRIVDFTPENGTTTSSTDVIFGIHAYINPNDIGYFLGVQLTLHNIDDNIGVLSSLGPGDITFLDHYQATTSGDFYYASTTSLLPGGYTVEAKIQRSWWDTTQPFSPIDNVEYHQFTVIAPTYLSELQHNAVNLLNTELASTTATTTIGAVCSPIKASGTFGFEYNASSSLAACATALIVPDSLYLSQTFNTLYNAVLVKFPFGYITRAYALFNSNATTSLPAFTVHFVTGTGDGTDMATTSLSFDMQDTLNQAGTILTNTRDPIYGQNTRDVFEPIIQMLVALSVVLIIISDIMGSHENAEPHADTGNKQKKT